MLQSALSRAKYTVTGNDVTARRARIFEQAIENAEKLDLCDGFPDGKPNCVIRLIEWTTSKDSKERNSSEAENPTDSTSEPDENLKALKQASVTDFTVDREQVAGVSPFLASRMNGEDDNGNFEVVEFSDIDASTMGTLLIMTSDWLEWALVYQLGAFSAGPLYRQSL